MNMKQFRYVLVLAEKGNFSRAAEELNVSQPSLSQYIKRIESELNITLFDRISGNVKLTDAGKIYIEAGKKILDTERQMQNKFSDLNEYNSGTLTVGIAPTRCQYLMPEIVKRFAEKYPGMHLVIEERFIGNLIDDAEHGEFDLCVATLPVDQNKFDYRLMMQEEYVLAVPENTALCTHLKQCREIGDDHLYPVIDIQDIDGADYVSISDNQPSQILLNGFCDDFGMSVYTVVKCMSIETQFSMVKAGIGIALIPSSLAKYSQTDSVAYFSVRQSTPERNMAVIFRKGQYISKPLSALIDIMSEI